LNRLNFPFSYLPEVVELDAAVQARYLRIEIDSTYKYDPTDTFAYAIVGEVVVDVVPDAAGFAADFDDDGDVDGLDLVEWQGAFGVSGGGDADEDGDSDGEDYLIWQRQLGMTSLVAAASAVPEPATGLAFLAGMLAVVRAYARVARLDRSGAALITGHRTTAGRPPQSTETSSPAASTSRCGPHGPSSRIPAPGRWGTSS